MTGWQQHRSTFARGASCLQKRHPSISRHGPKNPIYRAAHSFFISLPFKSVARVAFKRGAYLRHFVYRFAELLSDRLSRDLIARAMTGHVNDYEL